MDARRLHPDGPRHRRWVDCHPADLHLAGYRRGDWLPAGCLLDGSLQAGYRQGDSHLGGCRRDGLLPVVRPDGGPRV